MCVYTKGPWCWGAPSRLRNANNAGGLATKPICELYHDLPTGGRR